MKLNVKYFSLTAMIIGSVPLMILFIWSSANGFGIDIVRLFESIHPSGGLSIFNNMTPDKAFISRIPGILIDTAYAVLDFFIIGFAFSSLYNFFIGISSGDSSD